MTKGISRNQPYWDRHYQWQKERDEAVLSLDLEKFKAFYIKWMHKGVYGKPLPQDDHIIETAMRQMILGLANPPKEKADEAKRWLRDHGYSDEPWR